MLSTPSLKKEKGTEMSEIANTSVSETNIMEIYQKNTDGWMHDDDR